METVYELGKGHNLIRNWLLPKINLQREMASRSCPALPILSNALSVLAFPLSMLVTSPTGLSDVVS